MGKGYQAPAGPKPQNPPSGGSSVKAPALAPAALAQPELPVARELLGETVIVKTLLPIAGRTEHAAIVTRELGDDVINVILFSPVGEVYPIDGVHPEGTPGASIRWRHRR